MLRVLGLTWKPPQQAPLVEDTNATEVAFAFQVNSCIYESNLCSYAAN